jgi:hypothetical protein
VAASVSEWWNVPLWSTVENRRRRNEQNTQCTVIYPGEINDTEQAAWRKHLEAFDRAAGEISSVPRTICSSMKLSRDA